MTPSKKFLGMKWGSLSRREKVILFVLMVLLVFYVGEHLISRFFLEPRQALAEAVVEAEELALHHSRLLSREELIHAEYKKLENPVAAVKDTALTETEVLRELAELAGNRIHVKSVVPRLGFFEGSQMMFVALDFEGPFDSVVAYVETLLNEIPCEVDNLSLAPRSGDTGGVVCRLSLRVEYFES